MSTAEQRQRRVEIREYIRQNWLGRITKTTEARDDVMRQFGIDKKTWSNVATELRRDIKAFKKANPAGWMPVALQAAPPTEPPPANSEFTLDIPDGLDTSAKLAFAKLVEVMLTQRTRLNELELAQAAATTSAILADKKIRFLKKLVGDLSDAL